MAARADPTPDRVAGVSPGIPEVPVGLRLVARASGLISTCLVAAMLAIICYDVLLRYAFNAPTTWANELSVYLLAGITFLGLAHAHAERAHVRVDIVLDRLPASLRHAVSLAVAWIGLWYVCVLLWQAVVLVVSNHTYGTRSYGLLNTPVYLPQIIVVAGLAALALSLVGEILARQARPSRPRILFAVAAGAGVALALHGFGLAPAVVADSAVDWGSILVFCAWLAVLLVWSGPWIGIAAVLPVVVVGMLLHLGAGAGLGGLLGAFAVSILLALALGLPVAIALGVVGHTGLYAMVPIPTLLTLAERAWSSMGSFTLTAIPMFVLMGAALLRSGVSSDLFNAFTKWMGRVPGGIAHAGIGACTIFSAVSGSSIATASTIGMVACPEMERRRYDPRINYGAIAAGGTLGILIPPSVAMIIYASIVGVSVTQMFMAGIVPGLLLSGAFMAFVFAWAAARPLVAPREAGVASRADKLGAARAVAPVLALIAGVLGSLYAGVATPTEAAAVGALGAFLLCAARGRLTFDTVRRSLADTAKVTSFLLFIIVGASILSYLFDFVRLATELVEAVQTAGLSPMMTLGFVALVYLVLGMFIDPVSMMIMTLPIVYPLITALGFDPVWFGIILVLLIEIGLITPPVGMNLYVLQGVNPHARSRDIMIGALPFVAIMLALIALLVAFPQIALWLPETIR